MEYKSISNSNPEELINGTISYSAPHTQYQRLGKILLHHGIYNKRYVIKIESETADSEIMTLIGKDILSNWENLIKQIMCKRELPDDLEVRLNGFNKYIKHITIE